jgi:hypothetical protein
VSSASTSLDHTRNCARRRFASRKRRGRRFGRRRKERSQRKGEELPSISFSFSFARWRR